VVVRVVAGPDRGAERLLEAGTLLVGSHPDNDLPLLDTTVSRYHAELQLLPQGVRVRDLGSRNGTFMGETRIDSALVVPGSELRLGQTRLQIVAADLSAAPPPSERRSFGGLSGKSLAMREVFAVLERVAPTLTSVLFEGDSGTGKTTAARAVHDASGRGQSPLVVLDAGAPPTGELARLVAGARGGSLLVERADMLRGPQQTALLPPLEARERGSLDVRFLTTSTRDLRELVAEGRFRRELYFHLSGVRVVLVPLGSRKEDIPLLVRRLLAEADVPEDVLDKDVLAALYAHSWPGNVRELRQLVTSGLDLRARLSEPEPEVRDATAKASLALPFKEAKTQLLARFERAYLVELLRRHGGNVSHAALEAGLDRNYIARLVRRHGIRI
jgi:DNA-binding NtrC family response regulator